MVTNTTYLNLIRQIADLYCNDALCKAAVINRITQYFSNSTFPYFIAGLNNKRFYYGYYDLPMRRVIINNQYRWQTYFNYTDILTGASGKGLSPAFPETVYNLASTDWKKVLEHTNVPYLKFIDIVGDKIIFESNEHGGYGIALTAPQPITTGTPTTGGSLPNTGYIAPTTTPAQNSQPAIQGGSISKDFDLMSLLIPAGLVIAGYFLLKK